MDDLNRHSESSFTKERVKNLIDIFYPHQQASKNEKKTTEKLAGGEDSTETDQGVMSDRIQLLLIEDNPMFVHLFRMLLKELRISYELHLVPDGEEATKYIFHEVGNGRAAIPDLIFLDLNLPKKSGVNVLEEIKRQENFREIPVIILTSSDNREDIRRCYENHANCYHTKPSDLSELRAIVHQIENYWHRLVRLPKPTLQPMSQ